MKTFGKFTEMLIFSIQNSVNSSFSPITVLGILFGNIKLNFPKEIENFVQDKIFDLEYPSNGL